MVLRMVLQTKSVRYHMVFQRALAVMKRVLAAEGRATDANNAPGEPSVRGGWGPPACCSRSLLQESASWR